MKTRTSGRLSHICIQISFKSFLAILRRSAMSRVGADPMFKCAPVLSALPEVVMTPVRFCSVPERGWDVADGCDVFSVLILGFVREFSSRAYINVKTAMSIVPQGSLVCFLSYRSDLNLSKSDYYRGAFWGRGLYREVEKRMGRGGGRWGVLRVLGMRGGVLVWTQGQYSWPMKWQWMTNFHSLFDQNSVWWLLKGNHSYMLF